MTQNEKVFRVRRTDDLNNTWTVANGRNCLSTTQYISRKGTVKDGACATFYTEAQAQAALDLYKQKQNLKVSTTKAMREFDGGATRDTDTTKLDYEGFNNPLVDRCYAVYLNRIFEQASTNSKWITG